MEQNTQPQQTAAAPDAAGAPVQETMPQSAQQTVENSTADLPDEVTETPTFLSYIRPGFWD